MVPPRYGHQADEARKSGRRRSLPLVNTVDSMRPGDAGSDWSLHMTDSDAAEAARIQADRAISTGKLNASPHFHTRPINVVVSHGSQGRTRFEAGFPLRCFQRLSFPYLATRLCRWRDNRSTRGTSTPVLSY